MGPESTAPQVALETLLALSEQLGRSTGRPEVLQGSLEVLCRLFETNTGWITLKTASGEEDLAAVRGLPPALSANDCSALRWTPCRCQSLQLRDSLEAPRVIPCDRLELASGGTAGLRHHATAELKDGDEVLGLVHLAVSREEQLSSDQAAVLEAAGRMIGLALTRVGAPAGQEREQAEQAAMLQLTSKLLGLLDVDQIAAETVRILAETFPSPLIGVLTFEPPSRTLVLRASAGLQDRSGSPRIAVDDPRDPLAAVARDLKAAVLQGQRLPELTQQAGVRAIAAVPMAVAGKLVGLLIAGAQDAARFTGRELDYLSLAADRSALAFDRTRLLTATRRQVRDLAALHEQAAAQTRQLSETYGATLAVLGDALELRDEDTMGHTERVVGLAVSLGRQLGLSQEELMHLEWGAYVHDLGKIGVPDAVLRKPGPLSPEEWKLMQRHPEQGYALLQRLLFLSRSLDVVRFHHERYDGKGYPSGLKGEEIPLLARIFAVADAYDAMTNDRPYRRAMTAGEALQEILRNRGSQFDPAVVDALEQLPETERSPMRRVPQDVPEAVARELAPTLVPDGDTLLAFAHAAGSVLRAEDLPSALDIVVAEIQRRFGYPSCAILLIDSSAGQMQLAAHRGYGAESDLLGADQGMVVGRVLESATPYYARDIEGNALPYPLRSELALPLSVDGSVLGVLDVGSPEPDAFPDAVRSVLEAFAMLVSFTVERARRDAELQRMALTDPLTGLNNQRAVLDAAERELARATRHTKSVSLLAIHLDQFSDLHRQGRKVSEEAVRTVARLLNQTCRTEDIAGRREGGEYLLVLPETAKVGALLVAERIRADLARMAQTLGPLSISVGVASLPDDGKNVQDLLAAADEGMYRAQRRGGNEVVAATRRAAGP